MLRVIFYPFLILMFLLSVPTFSSEEILSLKISDLEKWVRMYSPELKISGNKKELGEVSGYLNSGLEFTNPDISFKDESLKGGGLSEREQEVEISKSFEMPWLYALKRKGWRYQKEALELSTEEFKNEFLGRIRSGYVELVLLRNRVEEYGSVNKILANLLKIAAGKKREGFISPLNLRMIEVAVNNLNIHTLGLKLELKEKEGSWKQSAGIGPGKSLNLTTKISYIPPRINTEERLNELYRLSPGVRQWDAGQKEIREKIAAEKTGFFQDITLSAGYKKVSEGMEGLTFGISFGLPLLNLNTLSVKKRKLEMELYNSRSKWSINNGYREIAYEYGVVKKLNNLLKNIVDPPVSPSREIIPLLDAFAEGTLSVTDLLSGIQLFLEGMDHYNNALEIYYKNIFRLESKTGERIVTFK